MLERREIKQTFISETLGRPQMSKSNFLACRKSLSESCKKSINPDESRVV